MNLDFSAEDLKEGLVLPFDKPFEWTSFQLVNKVRYTLCKFNGLKKLKVGHAGTLDPLATGLLILCTGKATKQIAEIQDLFKEYEAEITLGKTTPSYDLETDFNAHFDTEHITSEFIREKLENFKGTINQVPPIYSAKNINGERAYKFARKGGEIELKANEIEIYDIDILSFKLPVLKLKIKCSKGTYIRSLANDLGKELNSGAHLSALRRTAIGPYTEGKAINLDFFFKKFRIM